MKYAICILAHKKPLLLKKLVENINADNTEVIIHLDLKCNIKDYAFIDTATFIRDRVKVDWGGLTMVTAMINLIDYVIYNTVCDYILFISGEDLPVVSPKYYDEYINHENNYFEYELLPKSNWFMGGMNRVEYYYPFKSPKSIHSQMFMKLQKRLGIKKNIKALDFSIYGGSQWININRATGVYILDHYRKYLDFFRLCSIPDEMIFQTIMMNSPYKDKVINTNCRYLRYDGNSSNAAFLDENDIVAILNKKPLFCRKIEDEDSFERLKSMLDIER